MAYCRDGGYPLDAVKKRWQWSKWYCKIQLHYWLGIYVERDNGCSNGSTGRLFTEMLRNTAVGVMLAGRQNVPRVPLIPLSMISQLFERIVMDIVGPLPRSSCGSQFFLVVHI